MNRTPIGDTESEEPRQDRHVLCYREEDVARTVSLRTGMNDELYRPLMGHPGHRKLYVR